MTAEEARGLMQFGKQFRKTISEAALRGETRVRIHLTANSYILELLREIGYKIEQVSSEGDHWTVVVDWGE